MYVEWFTFGYYLIAVSAYNNKQRLKHMTYFVCPIRSHLLAVQTANGFSRCGP